MKACLLTFVIHSLTSQFVSGSISTGYLLFGRNHLVIFILVSVRYVFSIFYSIFRICIFAAFCFVQSVAFADFQCLSSVYFSIFTLCRRRFSGPFFVNFLASFRCCLSLFFFAVVLFAVFLQQPVLSFCSFIFFKLSFIFLNFSLNICLFQLYVIIINLCL